MKSSSRTLRFVSVVGARPQFIKLAPVCRAFQAVQPSVQEGGFQHSIVHTGQHYDANMTEIFFRQMQIPEPDYNLGVGSGSHAEQLARLMEGLESTLGEIAPDWLIVYGDTNSTLAAALIAARLGISVAHIEAGCRSYNRHMPEEQNRTLTDHLSQLLLAPCANAVSNLCREGIGGAQDPLGRRVANVGDVMYDALLHNLPIAEQMPQNSLEKLGLEPGGYYLLTLHRAENTDNAGNVQSIMQALQQVDLPVVFPVHPRTAKTLAQIKLPGGRVRQVAPLGYFDMLLLEKNARKILTDSGGVQKEAFYLGVPCITLRQETEWPETVDLGANCLAGIDAKKILQSIHEPEAAFDVASSPFGFGRASNDIVAELLKASAIQ